MILDAEERQNLLIILTDSSEATWFTYEGELEMVVLYPLFHHYVYYIDQENKNLRE